MLRVDSNEVLYQFHPTREGKLDILNRCFVLIQTKCCIRRLDFPPTRESEISEVFCITLKYAILTYRALSWIRKQKEKANLKSVLRVDSNECLYHDRLY